MTETSKRHNRRKRKKWDNLSVDNISQVPSNVGCLKDTITDSNNTNNINPNYQQQSCWNFPARTVNSLPKESDYHQPGTVNNKTNNGEDKNVKVITAEEGNNDSSIVGPSNPRNVSGKKSKDKRKRKRSRDTTKDDSRTDNISPKKKSRVDKQASEVNQDPQRPRLTSIQQHHRIVVNVNHKPTTEAVALHGKNSSAKNLPLDGNVDNCAELSSPLTTKKKKNKKKKKKKNKRRNEEGDDCHANNHNNDDVNTTATTNRTEQYPLQSSLMKIPSGLDNGSDSIPDFPYPVESDDHCESPLVAYEDIVPLLQKLNSIRRGTGQSNKTDVTASTKTFKINIYDPYYCDGAMKRNLETLGFENVYHVREDCYAVWDGPLKHYPNPMDVLITNPPYSSDHIEKLIHHITSSSSHFARTSKSGTPAAWFLLLPTWVSKKDYYVAATKDIHPFYLVPRKRYVYKPPTNFRVPTKSDVHKKSSPFTSMWYCYGGNNKINEILIQHYLSYSRQQQQKSSVSNISLCDLARSKSALRDLRRKQR